MISKHTNRMAQFFASVTEEASKPGLDLTTIRRSRLSRSSFARRPSWKVSGSWPAESPTTPDFNASIVASKGLANWSIYSATKAAVAVLRADMDDGFEASSYPRERSEPKIFPKSIPFARFGTPDEIARAVLFSRVGR